MLVTIRVATGHMAQFNCYYTISFARTEGPGSPSAMQLRSDSHSFAHYNPELSVFFGSKLT